MKYDSSMTQFHKDIIAALKHMCGNNTEITEKFSPKDGSPAPLRDYLKEKYGKSYTSHIGDGMRYSCKTSTGIELAFDIILNNPGDKNLTLSWSQAAKFIRDNWDEIFKKSKPKSRPLEVLVKTFDESEISCPNWIGGKTLTYREAVNGVHFECEAFSAEFCKLEDITGFFLQHCNCPENCMYCKETAEKQPSYIDKLRERYPKVNETDEWFDTVYCPSELFDGDGINDPGDDECDYTVKDPEACQKCWRLPCPANAVNAHDENFEEEYFEHYPTEDTAEENTAAEISEEKSEMDKISENQVVPQNAENVPAAFDYSELDGDTADKLKAISDKVLSIKTKYIIDTAKQVKAAHDLLANHYKGLFGAWCKSVGYSRDTGENLVRVAEVFPEFSVAENFGNLKASLLYEASRPSAPKELVEQVKSGDITTHKDYIALKKQLDEANKLAETEKKAREAISQNRDSMEEGYREFKDKYTKEYYKNVELEKRVKELESRPVDVCVDHNEVTKRVAEAVSKINDQTEQTIAAREQEFAETLHFKDERIWALEDKLKELSGDTNTNKKIYLVSMTDEDYQKILAELSGGFRDILETAAVVDIK